MGLLEGDWVSLVTQKVKSLPAMQETWVQSLGQEDTVEKEMPIINPGLLKRDEILLGKCPSCILF